jgi:predicted  nucleic acid-binding Zn-ribbon protein
LTSQATLLYRLQTVDLAIGQRQNRLSEIEKVIGANQEVVQAQQQLQAADQSLAPWQTRSRNLDLEIKSVVQKIQATEQSLYSGSVKNPKELREMENEIESLRKRQGQLEDEMLEAMVRVEDGQVVVADARQALNKVQALWAGSQTDLLDEKQRLETELEGLRGQRKQAAAAVEPASLTKYEALRPKKRGQAVALLQGDSCVSCGVEQTSMIAQQVRQGAQIIYCGSCGRILAATA